MGGDLRRPRMKAHRFFVSADQLRGDAVRFSEDQAHQLRSVLRLRIGDVVRVFDGLTPVDRLVELVGPGQGAVVDTRPQPAEPKTKLAMYPALLHRDKFEPVLQKLTEIGAAAITPVITARSLVREPPDQRRQERWRAILREAAEQCGRGVVPDLLPAKAFAQAIDSAEGTVVVAYERERRRGLRDVLVPPPPSVALFVGPEGGFAPEEADCAERAGAHLVTLGRRVLRTETASPVLAALVLYELGDLSSGFTGRDDDEPGP
jgi:16S rRNA (uracil1498-N3)-methyltransferase